MIPVLFKKDETQFRTYGLGELSDFLDTPEVKRERNGHYTFYMKYALDGVLADQLEEGMKIKSDAGARTKWQTFEINRVLKKTGQPIEVFAKHISMRTAKDAIKPRVKGNNLNGQQLLQLWRNNLVGGDHWEVWSDITTQVNVDWSIEDFNSAQEVLAGREGSILDRIGGEYEFDNQLIRLWRQMGRTAPTVLEYGRNIVSVEKDNQEDSVYTSVYPYAVYTPEGRDTVEMVTLPEIYIDSPYIDMYDHRKVQTVDFTTEFDFDNPPTVARLRELTSQYIENNEVGSPWENIRVEYQDLSKTLDYQDFKVMEEVELNDVVPVFYPKFNIMNNNAKVVVTVYDPVKEEYKYIELGVIGQRFRSVLTGNLTERLNRVEKEQKQQHQYIVNSAGNRIWYTTPDDSIEHKIGDVWFEKNGQYTRIRVWNGSQWIVEIDNEDVAKNAAAIAEAQEGIEEAKQSADTANQQINDAINAAGFSTLADLTADIQSISNQAEANAQTALSRAADAQGLANDSISRAQDALSSANNAVGIAQDASSLATTLSGQVSDYELTVDGFTQLVNNYEDQVAQFTSDVNGLNSTVASYESELNNYATQVSQFENTVNGLNSTVSSYQSDVQGYEAQVATLTNTVSGFESTVTEVRNEFDNLEFGGRNLLRGTDFSNLNSWNSSGYAHISETVTYNGRNSVLIYQSGRETNNFPGIWQEVEYTTPGDKLTVSVYILSDDISLNDQGFYIRFSWRNSNISNTDIQLTEQIPDSGKWFKAIGTVVVPEGTTDASFRLNFRRNGTAYINSLKLENGTKATDWTPAPEDMATSVQVATLSNTVDGLKSEVESYEQTVDGYSAQVASFENTLSGLNSTVSNFQSDVNSYQSQVAVLTNTVDGFNATVESVQADYSNLSGTVQSLGASIGVVEGQITNRVWQTDIQTAVDGIEVGGRNLILGTSDEYERIEIYGWFVAISEVISFESIGLKDEEIFTVSLVLRPLDNHRYRIRFEFYNNANDRTSEYGSYVEPSEERTSSITTIKRSAYHSFRVLVVRDNPPSDLNVDYKALKLERGTKATDWTPAPEDTLQLISHVETEWRQTAQGFEQDITRVETGLDGKASLAEFNTLSETVEGSIQTIGNIKGDITRIEANVNGIQSTVADKASQAEVTQLSNLVDTKVTSSQVTEAILEDRRIKDTRDDNEPPSWYQSNYRRETVVEFKRNNVLGITGEGTYGTLETTIPWTDRSGGNIKQRLTTDSAIWERSGTRESWDEWRKIADQDWVGSQLSLTETNILARVVSKDGLMSQINIEAGRTLIQSNRLYLDSGSVVFSGNAFIPNAAISSLSANKITTGTLNAANLNVINLNTSDIVGLNAEFVRSSWNSIDSTLTVDATNGIRSIGNSGGQTEEFSLTNGRMELRSNAQGYDTRIRLDGVGLRFTTSGRSARMRYNGTNIVFDNGSLGMNRNHINSVDWIRIIGQEGDTMDTAIFNSPNHPGSIISDSRQITIGLGTREAVSRIASFSGNIQFMRNLFMNSNTISGAHAITFNDSTTMLASSIGPLGGGALIDGTAITIGLRTSADGRGHDRVAEFYGQIHFYRNLYMNGRNVVDTSDERKKHGIVDSEQDSLQMIRDLTYRNFYWNDSEISTDEQFGLVAQEVDPSLTLYNEGKDEYGINQNRLTHTIGHAVQQLSKEHDNTLLVASHAYLLAEQHEDELECLRKEVKELKEEIEELRGMDA